MCKAAPEIPQLWTLCFSWAPEGKPCPPRAEPGSCFNWQCPGVTYHQVEVGEASFCAALQLSRGFSQRLAMTHSPLRPPTGLRGEGHGPEPCQDREPPVSAKLEGCSLQAVGAAHGRHGCRHRGRLPIEWEACGAPRQLPRWAVTTQRFRTHAALAAA